MQVRLVGTFRYACQAQLVVQRFAQ